MYTILLVLIYIAFISLGLPDSLLGSGWSVMGADLGVPISSAGILSMIISGGTILSGLMSDWLTHKLKTGPVVAISVFLTAAALMGFSFSGSFAALCLWAVPYGFGAGAIDAALNNYVALHYTARHMSWLHCFWGVGTIVSPNIMSFFLTRGGDWHGGYRCVSYIQIAITLLLTVSLPLWKKAEKAGGGESTPSNCLSLRQALSISGVKSLLIGFFAYCSAEATVMLWASSYLVRARSIPPETAAAFASLFFIGITAGRFISGIVSDRLGDRRLIRIGAAVIFLGIACVALPLKTDIFALGGFVVIGFGCAPVYPSIIHSTPYNFGKENSQSIIGIQMASAYVGSTFMPPVFGLIARFVDIRLLPAFLVIFVTLMIFMTERTARLAGAKSAGTRHTFRGKR